MCDTSINYAIKSLELAKDLCSYWGSTEGAGDFAPHKLALIRDICNFAVIQFNNIKKEAKQ